MDISRRTSSKTDDSTVTADQCSDNMAPNIPERKSIETFMIYRTKFYHLLANIFWILLVVSFSVYLGYALYYCIEDNVGLILISGFLLLYLMYKVVHSQFETALKRIVIRPLKSVVVQIWYKKLQIVWYVGTVVGLLLFLWLDVARRNPVYLISAGGIVFFIGVSFLYSNNKSQVVWRTVYSGVLVQLVIGLIVLRWPPGAAAIEWLAEHITWFILFGRSGAEFVFGESFTDHPFAMEILPMLAWFSAVIAMLQYWGIMNVVVEALGGLLAVTMSATRVEAFVATADIFFGPESSIIMVRPMVETLSSSQLHTLMACGLASIDIGMIPLFQSFGVPASHLLAASCMSAPAALCLSKLIFPEERQHRNSSTEEQTRNGASGTGVEDKVADKKLQFSRSTSDSSLEAFSSGASQSVSIIPGIMVILMVAVSLLEFVNTVITWMGDRVGVDDLTLQKMMSYPLMPVAFMMGVPWVDCGHVGELIGIKTIINELVAYSYLSNLMDNREKGIEPSIEPRSETIATYALCGFSNIGTVGMLLGFLSAMAPSRTGDVAMMATRSLVTGSFACFMTACMAGLLYEEEVETFTNSSLI